MFERYTELARRAIFYARYEAAQLGSAYIETDHLLLGLVFADPGLMTRLGGAADRESLRQQVAAQYPGGKKVTVSVDLPLSKDCRRVLEFAKEEARELQHDRIDPEHLLLGILRQEKSFAAGVLQRMGISPEKVRLEAARPAAAPTEAVSTAEPPESRPVTIRTHDLTRAARGGTLTPLIGRERELERAIQILSRRTRNNLVLVGEPGVGKTAIIEGLAQRIAEGNVPPDLAERPVLAMDAAALVHRRLGAIEQPNAILCVEGLFDLAVSGAGWNALEAVHLLEPHLRGEGIRCVATGTPLGFRQTTEKAAALARHFEPVYVLAPSEEEATRVLQGLKEQYERFHGIEIGDEAIAAAVRASARFLPNRQLPDRAIDLIDEAGAHLKLRRESEPRQIVELRRRTRETVRNMETAIVAHQFDKAREFAEAERRDRENLLRLLEERKAAGAPGNTLTAPDIEEVIAGRTGAPLAAVKTVLQQDAAGEFALIARELGAQIPLELREWVPFLAAWLANCSADDAERLASSIRALKRPKA